MTAPRPTLTDLARDAIAALLWPLAALVGRVHEWALADTTITEGDDDA